MRKLFSILAVALLALSAHATVVTQDLEFSRFSKYGEGEEATVSDGTITATVAWKGAQYWFGEGEYAFDASEYEALVLELASTSTVGVNYTIDYADGTASNDITIDAGNTSAQLPLKSNKIKNIVIKLAGAGSATLSSLYFKGYAGKVSEEAVGFDQCPNNGNLGIGNDAWKYSVQAYSGRFSSLGIQVDDKLVIKYELSGSADGDQFRIFACADADNEFNFASENGSCVTPEAGTTSIAFPLNSADLTLLTSKGIKIDGKNMTITGISVLKHAVLWTGSQAIGNWSNTFDIPSSKLSDLQVGNILCLRVSEIGTTDAPRVTLAYGDSWTIFNPTVEYYFQSGDEAPMVVEFPVTYKMKQQLDGNKLVIRGVNYTVTDIFIKEGTPTNTVAGYLNVTDAGMATLVLPFDVPTLPTGVQAYKLTNNGDATIWATEVDALEADKPVLIVAAEGEYEFVSEEGTSDDISSKTATYTNGALVGTYTKIDQLAEQTSGAYNYVLNNGANGVAFYQVQDASCSVDPYRAYLSCGYNASAAGPTPAPMRIVFHKDGTTGVENAESAKMDGSTKFIRDGQLIILRNGVEYNANGALVK